MTFDELNTPRTQLRQAAGARTADRFAVEWHKKPALAALCLVLALSGVPLSRNVERAWLRFGLGLPLLAITYVLLRAGEQAAGAHRLDPAVGIWVPVLTMAALTLLLFRWRRSARAFA